MTTTMTMTTEPILQLFPAALIDDGGSLKAWVERVVRKDPDIRWIVGNYVEADNANDNGHIFPLDDLATAQHTIPGKPLNMLHRDHYIVGAFAGAQLVAADGGDLPHAAVAESQTGAYIEAVAGMWHTRFAEEYFQIQRAHKEGSLFFSMEAVPAEVSCPDCSHRVPFAGLESDTYCDHMSGATGPKILHEPVFAGGAIIIPPVRPGWSRADIKTISDRYNTSTAEAVYGQVAAGAPHLGSHDWEMLMGQVLLLWGQAESERIPRGPTDTAKAADYSKEERARMAKEGLALPDGTYPIRDAADLGDAISLAVFGKDQAQVRAHIIKRAKALGLMEVIPRAWLPSEPAMARDVSGPDRQKMAKQGMAMPDGSFPIANKADLMNAIRSIGRAKNPDAAKAHIKKRAKALGLSDLIPEGW